jgi:hypothetical protein
VRGHSEGAQSAPSWSTVQVQAYARRFGWGKLGGFAAPSIQT